MKTRLFTCLYFGCLSLFSSCCKDFYMHVNNRNMNPVVVIGQSLRALTGITETTDSIKSGSKFLYILLPGIPLDESQISFMGLPGDSLLGSVDEIDKAYLFSSIVNKVLESRNPQSETGIRLDKFYPDDGSKDLLRITSPTYNDDFLLNTSAVSSLCLKNDCGMFYTCSFILCDSVKLDNCQKYTVSAQFIRIPILRPWFHDGILTANQLHGKAYVSEIIVADNLQVTVRLPENRNRRKGAETILGCGSKIIIAFICTVF